MGGWDEKRGSPHCCWGHVSHGVFDVRAPQSSRCCLLNPGSTWRELGRHAPPPCKPFVEQILVVTHCNCCKLYKRCGFCSNGNMQLACTAPTRHHACKASQPVGGGHPFIPSPFLRVDPLQSLRTLIGKHCTWALIHPCLSTICTAHTCTQQPDARPHVHA